MIGGSPRILLVRLSAFGDCLHAVPTLVALRRHFPNAEIGWAIEALSHSLLKGHQMVDHFHVFPRQAFKWRQEGTFLERMQATRSFRKELAAVGYEIAIDLQGLTKSGLVTWWSGAKHRIGFRGEDSHEINMLFNSERITPPHEAVHVVEKNLSLLQPLSVQQPHKPEWIMPSYQPEIESLRTFLAECGLLQENGAAREYCIVNPGATWVTKRWAPESFGAVAKGLIEQHHLPVIVPWVGEEEKKAAQIIVAAAGTGAFLAPPTDLRQLAALISQTVLFVGNDTGPLHLAVAMNVHTVAIFGATDPLRNGPYGHKHRMQTGGVDCHPCWKTSCARKDLACLTMIEPETVLNSCAHSLKRRQRHQKSSAATC
ncbi:MAG: glycosyltransferase family 9 protein [Planctomycetota bacterium]